MCSEAQGILGDGGHLERLGLALALLRNRVALPVELANATQRTGARPILVGPEPSAVMRPRLVRLLRTPTCEDASSLGFGDDRIGLAVGSTSDGVRRHPLRGDFVGDLDALGRAA